VRPSADPRPLVLHCVHRFSIGGLENGIVNLINSLPADRWRHAVLAVTEVDPGFAQRIRRDDVHCVSLHKPPGQALKLYPRVWRLLRELRPAIMHTRNLGTLEFQLPAWAARVPGRVHGEHGRDIDDVQGTNRRHIALRRLFRPFVQQQIVLGAELAAYLKREVGVPAARLTSICNGVDLLRFTPAASRTPIAGCPFTDPSLWLVGSVGRLQPVKAQTLLVRAFIAALHQQPALRERLRLVLVGDGPLRGECEVLLREAGMAELAWLAGERADVPEVMRGLNCFVLPSLAEGISNTILEAMASGLPVLATDVGASAELVLTGVSGVVVPADDVPSLAAALLALAQDPARAAAMGGAGRRIVEQRFSLSAMVAAYEVVYQRLLMRKE
jgi:sugar transferase (PEP-CTERM/EpsH1 system associated)